MQKISEKTLEPRITIEDLSQIKYDLQAPFRLVLKDHVFRIQKILRHLPKKRLTALAIIDQKPFVLKLFYAKYKRHYWHARQEYQGYKKISQSGLAIPLLLEANISYLEHYSFIRYEYLDNAKSLYLIWQEETDLKKKALLDLAVILIAKLHQQGLYHIDLHFENFLFFDHTIYIIDHAAIRGTVLKPLSIQQSLKNLGLLLAQIPPHESVLLTEAGKTYLKARHWLDVDMKPYLSKQRWDRETYCLAKTLRHCSDYYQKTTCYWHTMMVRDALGLLSPSQFLKIITFKYFPREAYLKKGNSAALIKIPFGPQFAVLKRYHIKSYWHALKRSCRASRAENAWRFGHFLQLLDIPTPKPIAYAEKRYGVFRNLAFLLYVFHEGQSLDAFIRVHADIEHEWQPIMDQVIILLQRLSQAKLIHGDLKASNFLVTRSGVMLLDLDSMQRIQSDDQWHISWQKERRRFLANFIEHDKVSAYCMLKFKEARLF